MLNLRRSFFLGFVAILLAFASSAWAQKTSGTIAGTVTDDSGALVAGASVTVTSVQTGASRSLQSNSTGSFSFEDLNPGIYHISVTKQGFKKVEANNVELHVSDITNVPIKLPVGALVETVEVEATPVQVETETGTVGNVVNGDQVRELPLNGRNFVALTTMMPGAAVAEGFDPKNKGLLSSVDISFSGAPANGNQWLVDGANNNDVGSQHTILVYPSIDAIEEFKILRNSYGPEFGGAGGSQINIVTRGGGNAFHGSAFYFGRNDALNAKNYLLNQPGDRKQLLRRNDFGYTVGGPIKKDKVFFFWSEEWNREKRARVRENQVPTANMLNGDFSELRANGCPNQIPIDPRTGKTFANDQIPAADISTAGQTWLSQISLPNRPNPCGINWVQGVTIPVYWREENVRGDINVTKSSVLTLRYTQDAWTNLQHSDEEGGLWGEQNYPSLSGNWSQPGYIAIAKLTTTIGTNSVNDFSFAWSANRINVTAGGDTPSLNTAIQQAFPYVYPASGKLHKSATATPLNWGGGPSGLTGHFGPWNNAQDLFTWKDDYSRVVGRHSLKIGGLYSMNKKNEETGGEYGQLWGGGGSTGAGYINPANGNQNVTWGGGVTGGEYGDYLLKGTLFGYGENVTDGTARGRWHDLELYTGDSWKIRPRLTLEYGARWSLTPPVYDDANRYSSFEPNLYNPALGATLCNGILLPKGTPTGAANPCPAGSGGTIGTTRGLAPTNYHDIAPRVGFAWDAFGNGKFALRGGVGQFFARDPISILILIEGNNAPFAIVGQGLRTLDGPLCQTGGTSSCPFQTLVAWGNSGAPASGVSNSNKVANNWQWNLTTETALWKNAKLELGYVGLRGIHLNSSRNLNQVAPANRLAYINAGLTGGTGASKVYFPYKSLFANGNNTLNQFGDFGDSVYHSLQATFQTKISHNSQFQTSYTYSKSIADTTMLYIGTQAGALGLSDTYDPRIGRGNSDFDRRHILNASLVYNLPALEGSNSFVKGAIGGWEASTIANFYSGAAIRVQGSVNGICDMDIVSNASGTTNDCAPGTGMHPLFNGNPWGIGNNQASSQLPNRNSSQPCHVSTSNRTQWLNYNAYTWTGFKLGGYPDGDPGACSGPGVADADFSILKNWGLPFHGSRFFGEKSKLQFRMEFFNLFNHPMFRNTNVGFVQSGSPATAGSVGSRIVNGVIDCSQCTNGNGIFGVANTPSNIGNREIQYALKLIF